MEIDEVKLRKDIFRLVNYLSRHEKASSMQEMDELRTLCQLYKELTGIDYVFDFFLNKKRVDHLYHQYDVVNANVFRDFCEMYFADLVNCASKLEKSTDKNNEYYMQVAANKLGKKMRYYNEKEFKEIILSYYAEYGDDIYNLVKEYFDNSRIGMGVWTEVSEAYFANSFLGGGYVANGHEDLSTYSLGGVVHELGHAIDYKKLYLNQGKKLSTISDTLLETPAHFFELSLYEYLIKNHIDIDYALLLINDSIFTDVSRLTPYKGIDVFDGIMNLDGEIVDEEGNLIYNLRDDIVYFLGTSIALNMMVRSKDNKKEFNSILNDYLCGRKERTFEQSLETLGISYEDFINGKYIKPYIKQRNKELIKRIND